MNYFLRNLQESMIREVFGMSPGNLPPKMQSKVVIYPKGMAQGAVIEALILSNQFTPNLELIEDTTETVVDNLLIYDKPDFENTLKPQLGNQ